ncbi:hypothetical protein HMPREF1556_01378, partial [Porphyromonas sp. oral taxon 278 str. W7784]
HRRPTVGLFFCLPIASAEEHLSTTYEPSKRIFIDDLENKKNITRFAVEICPYGDPNAPQGHCSP